MNPKLTRVAVTHWRTILYTLFCILCAVDLVLYSKDIGLRIFNFVAERQDRMLFSYLDEEGKAISQKIFSFSQRSDLRESLQKKDASSTIAILNAEKDISGLTAYTVADAHGIAISRAPINTSVGDNIFLTLPVGRAALNGETSAVYGPGRNFSLTMGVGSLIKDNDGDLLGAVFGGYWFDNKYAQIFKERYLNDFRHREVIFYSREEGVTGDSLEDISLRNQMRAYVTHASTLIQEGRSGDLLNIKGKDYVITNHLLTGEGDIYGGVLLLTQVPLTLFLRSMLVSALITLLFFISLLFLEKITIPQLLRFKKRTLYYFLFILTSIVFISVWTGIYSYGKASTMRLDKPEFTIYNSTMKVRPGAGVYAVGQQQQMSVVVYSGGEKIGAIEARLHFDPAVLRIDTLNFDRSICSPDMILEKSFDNTRGTLSIACAVSEQIFSDVRGILADVTFIPVVTGNAAFIFDENTHVFAADGLATDVLRTVTSGAYRVFDEKDISGFFSSKSIVIPYSLTHENSTKWYPSRTIVVSWPKIPGASYEYEISQDPSPTIANPQMTFLGSVSLLASTDGIFYFKVAPKKEGVTGLPTILQIKVDTTPPEKPTIQASNLSIKKNDIVRFQLSSEDAASGMQKNFYVRVDGSLWLPTFSNIYMPFTETGTHVVSVRVFDNAENYSESQVTIKVRN